MDTMEATGREKARFRVYSSPLRSFIDRNKLLNQFSRYVPVLNAGTPQEQIQALGKSGYATDPRYSEKLLKVWQEYDLSRLDTLRPLTLSGLGLFLVFELKNKNLI
jgi:flagellum-specific peptidoglycan hydrolase FlgJ